MTRSWVQGGDWFSHRYGGDLGMRVWVPYDKLERGCSPRGAGGRVWRTSTWGFGEPAVASTRRADENRISRMNETVRFSDAVQRGAWISLVDVINNSWSYPPVLKSNCGL